MEIRNSDSMASVNLQKKHNSKKAVLGGALAGAIGSTAYIAVQHLNDKPTDEFFKKAESVLSGASKTKFLRALVNGSKTFTGKYLKNPIRKAGYKVVEKFGGKGLYGAMVGAIILSGTLLGAALGKTIDVIKNKA